MARGGDVFADNTVSESPVHVEAVEKPEDADSSEDDRDDGGEMARGVRGGGDVFADNTVSE
jgi:hypothetical protein